MNARRRVVAAVLGATLALAVVPLLASPAGAVAGPTVVADGLNSPQKLTFGPDGDLYVAETGTAGEENCQTVGEGEDAQEICYGATGSVTEIDLDVEGSQTRVVTDLPSIGNPEGTTGPVDVAFAPDGDMHVITGFGGDDELRDAVDPEKLAGTVLTIEGGTVSVLSDLVAFEAANDPDQAYDEGAPEGAMPISEGVDSNPFGLTFDGDDVLAVDAGGNDVLRVLPDGTTSMEALLPVDMTEAPPFLGLPPGTEIPYQPVPTAIEMDGDTPLVGNLTGFPFPVGEAKVWQIADGEATPSLEGFTNIIDIDVAPNGDLYVLSFADNGLLSEEPAPALVQVREDGTRKYLAYGAEALPAPAGVEVGPDGMVYVSVCALCGPEAGMVWQFDPTVAADPAAASACDPVVVPGASFPDIKSSVHRETVECMAFWGAIAGFGDGTFQPGSNITRAQAASMLARALETAGVELSADAPDAFTDDDGVHEENIDKLAAAGIVQGFPDGTYHPKDLITRDQLASLFARAWDVVADEPLPEGEDAFTDDDGNTHEAAINAVAAVGWVNGVGEGSFEPRANATRGQFASMLARMLATMVDEGLATPPEAP